MRMRVLGVVLVGSCLSLASENAWAQGSFLGGAANGVTWGPGPTADITQSLGQFTIVVNPNFQPGFTGVPGYSSGVFTSPLLYDPTTQINRSTTTTWGSTGWSAGVPVGSPSGLVVSQGSLSTPAAFVAPPAGTDMVFTQINSFNLANGSGFAVTTGTAAPANNLPYSMGEVISLSGTPANPANDFPARSFFDVFVDISLPPTLALGLGSSSAFLTNAPVLSGSGSAVLSGPTSPLMISNSSISTFPPVVIYTHGNSTAVPIYVDAPGSPLNGDLFGLLTLAGHGAGYGDGQGSVSGGTDENTGRPADPTSFETSYMQMAQTPMPLLPSYAGYPGVSDPNTSDWAPGLVIQPEPSTLALLAVGTMGLAGFGWRRRRRIVANGGPVLSAADREMDLLAPDVGK